MIGISFLGQQTIGLPLARAPSSSSWGRFSNFYLGTKPLQD